MSSFLHRFCQRPWSGTFSAGEERQKTRHRTRTLSLYTLYTRKCRHVHTQSHMHSTVRWGEHPALHKEADTCCWRCFPHKHFLFCFFFLPVLSLSRFSPFLSQIASTLSPLSLSLGFSPKTSPLSLKWGFSMVLSVPLSLDMAFVLLHRSIHFMSMKNPHQDSRQSRLLMYSTFCG